MKAVEIFIHDFYHVDFQTADETFDASEDVDHEAIEGIVYRKGRLLSREIRQLVRQLNPFQFRETSTITVTAYTATAMAPMQTIYLGPGGCYPGELATEFCIPQGLRKGVSRLHHGHLLVIYKVSMTT